MFFIFNVKNILYISEDFSGDVNVAYISRPLIGKHMAFNGGFLHAAPFELKELFDEKVNIKGEEGNHIKVREKKRVRSDEGDVCIDDRKKKKIKGGEKNNFSNKRITLLVNIWLNHIPSDAVILPNKLLKQVSKLKISINNLLVESKAVEVLIGNKKKGGISKMDVKDWKFGEDNVHSVSMLIPTEHLSAKGDVSDVFKLLYTPGCHISVK